jgi:hypothetical protein
VTLGVAFVYGKATRTVVGSWTSIARMLREVAGSQFAQAWGASAKCEVQGYNRKSPERGALPGFSGVMRTVPEAVQIVEAVEIVGI